MKIFFLLIFVNFLLIKLRTPLINCLEKYLIGEHIPVILQKGLDLMLDEHRIKDLKLLYQLVSRIPNGVDQLRTAYSLYIKVKNEKAIIFIDLFLMH